MDLDIMQALVDLLCPTAGAQSSCQQFINAPHHMTLEPFGPLIYFLFFPMVFLIALIYIGSGSVLGGERGHKGIRLLVAIGVLIFIVIQGLYPLALWLGELWFIVLPVIFIFYFIMHHGGGGGKGGGMAGTGGNASILKMAKDFMIGDTPLNPVERKLVQDEINTLDAQIREQEDMLKAVAGDKERAAIRDRISDFRAKRTALVRRLKISKGRRAA